MLIQLRDTLCDGENAIDENDVRQADNDMSIEREREAELRYERMIELEATGERPYAL